jgi:hypothetical protein
VAPRTNITKPEDLFRRIDEFRVRAEVEERTEKQNVYLIARWLRAKGQEDLAKGIESLEWYPDDWRDAEGKPRP